MFKQNVVESTIFPIMKYWEYKRHNLYEDAQNTEVKNTVKEATVFPAITVIKGQAQPTRDCVLQQASPGAVWTMTTKLSSTVLVTVITDPSQVLQLNSTCGIQDTGLACNLHQGTVVWFQARQLGDGVTP